MQNFKQRFYYNFIAGLIILFIASLIAVFMLGCQKESPIPVSTFPQLSGKFKYESYARWENGLYEDYRYETWDFNNSSKAWNYWKYWSYTLTDGWINALKEPGGNYKEWKVENGIFYCKIWDNEYSKWKAYNFKFIDENNFELEGVRFTKTKSY